MINLDYLYDPESTYFDKVRARSYLNKNYFIDKKLGFQVIENGTILPCKFTSSAKGSFSLGGMVYNNGEFIKGSHVYEYITDKNYTPPLHRINST